MWWHTLLIVWYYGNRISSQVKLKPRENRYEIAKICAHYKVTYPNFDSLCFDELLMSLRRSVIICYLFYQKDIEAWIVICFSLWPLKTILLFVWCFYFSYYRMNTSLQENSICDFHIKVTDAYLFSLVHTVRSSHPCTKNNNLIKWKCTAFPSFYYKFFIFWVKNIFFIHHLLYFWFDKVGHVFKTKFRKRQKCCFWNILLPSNSCLMKTAD